MIIGILKEQENENRVALLPENVAQLVSLKAQVYVEKSAGERAFHSDSEYIDAGAEIKSRNEVIKGSNILVHINAPSPDTLKDLKKESIWLGAFSPLWNTDLVKSFIEKGVTSFSLDMIPRITRAQAMDVLSSMATVAGYKAVLDAASHHPGFFPMFMSAAGTIRPATVLIMGAGVAGLQAIATARKLGAQVEVFDVRSAVKEEVMSLGGKFVEVEGANEDASAGGYAVEQTDDFKQRQQDTIKQHASKADIIICTAQIPGRKAPILITQNMVDGMKPGSIIIDLATSTGGNCEMSKDNETVIYNQVTIIGQSNYPSLMPRDASKMFGKNVENFLELLINSDGELQMDFEDDIIKGTCITREGSIINERVKSHMEA